MAGFVEHCSHGPGHGVRLERQAVHVLAAEIATVAKPRRHVTLQRVQVSPRRIDHALAAGKRIRLAIAIEPHHVAAERIHADGQRLPLQTPVQVEGDPRSAGPHLPAVHAAANRRAAQAVGFFHQHHVDPQPGGGQRRPEPAAAAANDRKIARHAAGVRASLRAGGNRHHRQQHGSGVHRLTSWV